MTEDAILHDHNQNVSVKQEAVEKDDSPCASPLSHASSDDVYDVEKILDRRFNEEKNCYEYSLKWVGYRRPTWEEEKNIVSATTSYWPEGFYGFEATNTCLVIENAAKGVQRELQKEANFGGNAA